MSNVDINVDRRTDGRTDGRKIGRLYRTLLQAGAIKIKSKNHKYISIFSYFSMKTCCGYSLEVPWGGTSNEYPQPMFFIEK